jgi:hypothetical protein
MEVSSVDIPVKRLTASRCSRTMRGHTYAKLVDVGGHAYVTKLQCNPFGARALAAEWMGGHLMRLLGLPTPAMALIDAPSLAKKPLLVDPNTIPAGVHFASEYPGDPNVVAVYEFLPDRFLASLETHHTFAGSLAFDVWVANTDGRQAIFCKGSVVSSSFSVLLIDNTHIFGGPDWKFIENNAMGKYISRIPYSRIRDWGDFSPWLERIEQLVERGSILDKIVSSIPEEWLTQVDRRDLECVTERLVYRGRSLRESVSAYVRSSPERFPNWRWNI